MTYQRTDVKNPGIGSGGRPGMMKPNERIRWLCQWFQSHHEVKSTDPDLIEAYHKATGLNRTRNTPIGRDLTEMWEQGLLNRQREMGGPEKIRTGPYTYTWNLQAVEAA